MKSLQTHFFATRADQIALLRAVEARIPLKYVVSGLLPSREPVIYYVGTDIPTLGAARHENAINGDSYLVMGTAEEFFIKDVRQKSGDMKYLISQEGNQNTAIFLHGGFFDKVLLYGKIGTVWETDKSLEIYSSFVSVIKEQFLKIGSYYIGKGAGEFLKEGGRLTQAVQSPRDYDLIFGKK
jgi:hypothetical protein